MTEKRPAEEEPIPTQRYTRIRLASPSPEKSSGSDTESIHSCQGYETELVKDTSDTSSSSSPTYNNEYEVTDTEDQKGKFYLSDDSDDQEGILELDAIFSAVSYDSVDIAVLGDTSEENSTSPTSNSDADPGLPRNDYVDFEKCLLCQTDKKDISYPYCSTCFTWKKNLFPSRPRKRQKIFKKDRPEILESGQDIETTSFSNKNGAQNKNVVQEGNLSEGMFEDSGMGSSEPQLSEDVVDGPSQQLSQEPSTSSSTSSSGSRGLSLDMCRVCFLKPENGLFVHLNIVHVYGCYSCAKKIWYHSGSCPICRRKIFKVAKLYV